MNQFIRTTFLLFISFILVSSQLPIVQNKANRKIYDYGTYGRIVFKELPESIILIILSGGNNQCQIGKFGPFVESCSGNIVLIERVPYNSDLYGNFVMYLEQLLEYDMLYLLQIIPYQQYSLPQYPIQQYSFPATQQYPPVQQYPPLQRYTEPQYPPVQPLQYTSQEPLQQPYVLSPSQPTVRSNSPPNANPDSTYSVDNNNNNHKPIVHDSTTHTSKVSSESGKS